MDAEAKRVVLDDGRLIVEAGDERHVFTMDATTYTVLWESVVLDLVSVTLAQRDVCDEKQARQILEAMPDFYDQLVGPMIDRAEQIIENHAEARHQAHYVGGQ